MDYFNCSLERFEWLESKAKQKGILWRLLAWPKSLSCHGKLWIKSEHEACVQKKERKKERKNERKDEKMKSKQK